MKYHQITQEERYRISALRQVGLWPVEIARQLARHRSTISRELARNRSPGDGRYRPSKAQEQANGRRSRSRRNQRFGEGEWQRVKRLLRRDWSPEQAAGKLNQAHILNAADDRIHLLLRRLGMGDLTTAEADGDLDLVALLQEPAHVLDFEINPAFFT